MRFLFTLCLHAHSVLFSSQGGGSIAQLADSEFAPSPSRLSSPRETPVSDITHDTPSVLPYGSPMSDALSSPSPSPVDAEMDSAAPAEDRSPDLDDSRPLSPDASMEVIEDESFEVPDAEPLPPSTVNSDLPVDVFVLPPSISSEVAPASAESRPDTVQADVFEETEETIGSVAPSEAGLVQLGDEPDEDLRSEGLASPVISEKLTVQEDMDVDIIGEPCTEADEPISITSELRSQSALPQSPPPQDSHIEVQPSPTPPPTVVSAPILALPPSAFILPPKPSTEVFIPATLAPIGQSPQYALDLATAEPLSLTTSEWLNPEFSLNRNYTLPSAKSLPLDQQRRLKLGKSLRKRDKEKERGAESRKDGADDWTPLGINKWGVAIKANPLWKRVSRATKTMSTRDWNVSMFNRILTVLNNA